MTRPLFAAGAWLCQRWKVIEKKESAMISFDDDVYKKVLKQA